MNIFASPAPQWQDIGGVIAGVAMRVSLFVDADGDMAIEEGATPTRYMSTDGDGDLSADVTAPGTLRLALTAQDPLAF